MWHERDELLACARKVAAALGVKAADVPVEGYYADDPELTEYFRLLRALQNVGGARISKVAALLEFQRLTEVTGSAIYGRPVRNGKLLPVGRDALSQALIATAPEWTVAGLIAMAHAVAQETDDISLVALAALSQDPVVLAALRESVVLYAEWVVGSPPGIQPKIVYVWQVDDELADRAGRFVKTFNALFDEDLPAPGPDNAARYWTAHDEDSIVGRCVRLGHDDSRVPLQYYHWGICRRADGELTVHDFWDPEIWTTERYRAELRGRCPK